MAGDVSWPRSLPWLVSSAVSMPSCSQHEMGRLGCDLDVPEDEDRFDLARGDVQEDRVLLGNHQPLARFLENGTLLRQVEKSHGGTLRYSRCADRR